MPKKKQRRTLRPTESQELDGVFFLKLVLYMLLGLLWLKTSNGQGLAIGVPVGLMLGLAFATHEHFQIDRKIEYAVLLVATIIGYLAPFGLYIHY